MSDVEVLQTVLAAEHAAVYVLGVLGGQTSASTQPALSDALRDAYVAHRDRREELTDRLLRLGAVPVPAAVAYELPADLASPGTVSALARELEADSATTYGFMVGSTSGALRRWGVTALTDAAVRGLSFGAEPEPLPGA